VVRSSAASDVYKRQISRFTGIPLDEIVSCLVDDDVVATTAIQGGNEDK
jgi:hypothetical protein